MSYFDVIIVGAGQAGVQTAVSLHQAGYTGSIALLDADDRLPYERPPLSKGYLSGEEDLAAIQFRTAEYWDKTGITLRAGAEIHVIDPADRSITTKRGETMRYGRMVWAAGGTARKLPIPGSELDGVQSLRNLDDATRLQSHLTEGRRALIIGGGYIGLEVAAVFRSYGVQTTVVEAQERLLARVTSPVISEYFLQLHRRNGVEIILEGGVSEIRGVDGHVTGATLADGRIIDADFVLVGIGVIPNTLPLERAGGHVANGVVVDENCRTNLAGIYAAGDVAYYPSAYALDGMVRLESVPNAVEQGRVVANDILGREAPHRAVPWFWSNQYSTRLKTAGLFNGYDDYVVRGRTDGPGFSVFYLLGGRLIAADTVNQPMEFAASRRLIENAGPVDKRALGDIEVPLESALKTAV